MQNRWHLMVMLALLMCIGVGCAPTPLKPIPITVMTYNIHHGVGVDGKLDLPRIASIIKQYHPDFVALQEIDSGVKRTGKIDEPAMLAKLTDMHAAFGRTMDFDGGKYGDMVLSKAPMIHAKTIPLPWTPGNHREPRAATEISCSVQGLEVVFISTHLDHTPDPSDRLNQAMTLNDQFGHNHRPTVLAGDFNCDPDSVVMHELAKCWTITTADAKPSFPSDKPTDSIDHVLIRSADQWKVVSTQVIDSPVASDHRPVLVKLLLLKGGGF